MNRIAFGALGVAVLAGTSMAQTFTAAGPFNSDGADNAAANGVWSFTYLGAGGPGTWTLSGDVTDGGVGSYRSELRVRGTNTTSSATATSGTLATGNTWTGTFSITNASVGGLYNMSNGDTMTFRFWESYDDAGADATWSNLSATFAPFVATPPSSSIFLGNIGSPTSISSGGSGFDSEIGLYDSNGNLVAQNDDGLNTNPGESLLANQALANGTYYVAVTRYTSANQFGFNYAVTGTGAAATTNLSVTDGVSTFGSNGALAAAGVTWYSFNVIPTPGSAALLGCGILASARRRRA